MPICPTHFSRWVIFMSGPMAPPATPGDRKVVIVIFVVERVIRVELRHGRRMGFAISV